MLMSRNQVVKLEAIVNSEECQRCVGGCTNVIIRRMRTVRWVRCVSVVVKPQELL